MKQNGKHATNNKKSHKLFYFKIYFCLIGLIINIIIFSSTDYGRTSLFNNTVEYTSSNQIASTQDNSDNSLSNNNSSQNNNSDNSSTVAVSSSIIEDDINQTNQDTNSEVMKGNEEIMSSNWIESLIDTFRIENNLNKENFAFFYYDLNTSEQYFFNENKIFTAASTVKLPVAMIYYDKINSGEISLSDTLLYNSDDYEAGGGSTSSVYSPGDYVPLDFLLEQSIVNSDNTAVNILLDNYGYSKCKKEIVSKYTDETVSDEFYTSNLTYANYAFDILNYLYSHMSEYSQLIEYLKISSNGQYLKKYITDCDVAHKYGSYNGYVHDYGIVFSESPYLIGVFTYNVPNASELIANLNLEIRGRSFNSEF